MLKYPSSTVYRPRSSKRSPHSYSVLTALLLVVLVVSVPPAVAQNSPSSNKSPADQTWTDPAKAATEDPDFLIQGEYGSDHNNLEWGMQIVALGGGKFDGYLLEGGLPGAGWTRSQQRIKLSGERKNSAIELSSVESDIMAVLNDERIQVFRKDQILAELPRIVRKSPTLDAPPPAGAVVLFDGSSADAWINGQVENGLLLNNDITSKQTFNDYTIHLEFRTPYKPYARGQQRGNSGVYHQGRYETQVLDSFGLEGRRNECGGIYSIADPIINACLPPLTWQTYDIDFTAAKFDAAGGLAEPAKMTVRLNGILVQENQALPHTTTAAPAHKITAEAGPIFIQHHRNPVYYRNIWVVPK